MNKIFLKKKQIKNNTNNTNNSNINLFIDHENELILKRPSIAPLKYRSLLFREIVGDDEDKELLLDATTHGDIEIINHCYKYGLVCNSECISIAARNNHFSIITLIGQHNQHNNNCVIDDNTSNYLIINKNKVMLYHLLQNNMLSTNIIGQLISALV